MLDDLNRIGPVLAPAAVAAILLIWDLLPLKLAPSARGKGVMMLALLGPAISAAWSAALLASGEAGFSFDGSAVLDDLSFFFFFLFAGVTAAICLASSEHAKRFGDNEAEYYALILFASAAMCLLAASRDLILIFISLELTSISQYILAALRKDQRSTEAGMKYLLMGATASAVLLYGMAFLFGLTGTTRLVAPEGEISIASVIAVRGAEIESGLILASVFIAAGLAFKMAVLPFQMWAPDVYEGAPAPVAAFLSVASKAAAFAVALRIFFEGLPDGSIRSDWADAFAVIAALSMSVGNVLALSQSNVKRLLGYSSIAQAGNFLVGLAAVTAVEGEVSLGASGVLFFIATYAFTNLAAFLVVIAVFDRTGSDEIASYAGLARRSPWLAGALALALISLTGIPPTAGFVAKLYIFNAAIESDLAWLVIVAVLNSVVSAFYYLRLARLLFVADPAAGGPVSAPMPLNLALGVAVAGVLLLGLAPQPVLELAQDAAAVLSQ